MNSAVETAKLLADGSFDHALNNAIEHGIAEGIKIERRRVRDILGSPEAKSRYGTALHLATLDHPISVECARTVLAGLPEQTLRAANVVDIRARRRVLALIQEGQHDDFR